MKSNMFKKNERERQHKLGAESRLSARIEGGGKGEVSIYSILLTAVVSFKNLQFPRSNKLFPHSNFIPYL